MPRPSSGRLSLERGSASVAATSAVAEVDADALDAVLAVVREREGIDLSGYRRPTLARRVRNRMISASAASVGEYLARLRTDPSEAARLLDRLTIKVSRFFRNRAAAESVARALAAELARAAGPLAVWSAGCGRGEEPYTLAILLAELGQAAAASSVLATDVDPGALAAGRAGGYGEEALSESPPRVRERWLERDGASRFVVRPEVRARVTFARHDLARDAAPRAGAFDLVSCRNTLIYFDAPLQQRALGVLCDALRPGGLLWLGEAEWPSGAVAARLAPLDRQARLFRLEGPAHA